jgi:3,4-dihydroxy 2-butanone 4-phosphate synthase/GTP cyclohydrolase II
MTVDPLHSSDPAAAERAAEALANGGFVVLVESRSDDAEGNLTLAAQFVTPDAITVLSNRAHGVVRLCLTDERCAELGFAALPDTRTWQRTESIAHPSVSGSGASHADRARTIQAAIGSGATGADFVSGGYVFPLRARPGGVLRRAGRTEAAVDLAALAGCIPAAAMSLLMNEDGTVARGRQLVEYAQEHGLPLVAVGDVIAMRRRTERLVEQIVSARLPTRHGEFTAVGFRELLTGGHHVALVKGDVAGVEDVLVRVHRECTAGDVFRATTCGCAEALTRSLELIEAEGRGVLLHLVAPSRDRHFSRHRDDESDPGAAMEEYGIGAQILAELGLHTIRVLTDHARPIAGLEGFGLEVTEHVQLTSQPDA